MLRATIALLSCQHLSVSTRGMIEAEATVIFTL